MILSIKLSFLALLVVNVAALLILSMKHQKERLNLILLSRKRPVPSFSFDNSFLAYALLRKLDVFEVVEDLPMANYSATAWGFKAQEHYCDKHRAYFSRNPSIVFENPKFVTNYWKDNLVRGQVIPKYGQDIHPEVDPRSRGIKYKYKVEFGLDANIFFMHDLFHYRRQVGSQFSCISQAYNHIPGHDRIYKKDVRAQALVDYANRYATRPQCFNSNKYFLKTWVLSQKRQCQEFFNEINSVKYHDLKDEKGVIFSRTVGAGAFGNGAVFPLDAEEEEHLQELYQNGKLCGQVQKSNLIQYNILNPLLVENRQLNFRVFLLVASTNPLIAYYHDGYIKLFLHEDDPNTQKRNSFMMDDSSITMKGLPDEEAFLEKVSTQGNKDGFWTYQKFQQYLLEKGTITDSNWLNEHLRPELKKAMVHLVRMAQSGFYKKSSVFELYGLDFTMDENLNVWFVEANPMPWINGFTEETTEVMNEMLVDTFDIELGLLRSRAKRMILYINNLSKNVDSKDIPGLEDKRLEFKELTKNYFEPEFEPSPLNTFHKIIDENEPGTKKYNGLIQEGCL